MVDDYRIYQVVSRRNSRNRMEVGRTAIDRFEMWMIVFCYDEGIIEYTLLDILNLEIECVCCICITHW